MVHTNAIATLRGWERAPICNIPTPLRELDRLATHLGVGRAYAKMDAETGFALGGNKVRKLEFELAPSRIEGVSCVLTAGGPQSNHCRVTAAYAARLGLRCVLIVNGPEPERPTGNALLHRLFGAEIVIADDRDARTATMHAVAETIRAEGGSPLVVPIGASTGLGCLGYALAACELTEQLDALADGGWETLLFVPSSSCGTLGGLVLGLALLGRSDVRLFGISADVPARELRAETLRIASAGAELLGAEADLAAVDLTTIDRQVGAGYGIPTEASDAATETFGRLEGIILDPTYTAKAAAEMIEWVAANRLEGHQRLVFLHTGGAPGLLA